MCVCVFSVWVSVHICCFLLLSLFSLLSVRRGGGEWCLCVFKRARLTAARLFFFFLVASHIFIQTVLLHCVFHDKCQHHFRKKKNNSVFIIIVAWCWTTELVTPLSQETHLLRSGLLKASSKLEAASFYFFFLLVYSSLCLCQATRLFAFSCCCFFFSPLHLSLPENLFLPSCFTVFYS